jgi:hypothetical protein
VVLHNIHCSFDPDQTKEKDQDSERETKEVKFVAFRKGQGKRQNYCYSRG